MVSGYENEELVKDHVRALLAELEGAERTGNEELAKVVRKQLSAFGHKATPPAARAEKRPAVTVEKRATRKTTRKKS